MSINKSDVTLNKLIGEGTYGMAYTGKYKFRNVIIKKIKSSEISADFCKEILLLKYLNGRGTIQYYGNYLDGLQPCIVMEHFGQSIDDSIITPKRKLIPEQYMLLFNNIITAFRELHKCGIIHNDIKAANILVNDTLDVKVIDYGLAEYVGLTPMKELMNYYITTETVKDPENIKGFQSESYSIGVTLVHILTRSYYNVSIDEVTDHIMLDDSDLDDNYYDSRIGNNGSSMLKALINDRVTLSQILEHPYFGPLALLEGAELYAGGSLITQDTYTSIYEHLSRESFLHYPYLDSIISNLSQNKVTFNRPDDDHQHQFNIFNVAYRMGISMLVSGEVSFNSFINSIIFSNIDRNLLTLGECYSQFMAGLYIFSTIDLYYELDISEQRASINPFINKIIMNKDTRFIPVWDSIEYILYHYQYAIDHVSADVVSPQFIETYRNALVQTCLFFAIFGKGLVNFNEICQFVAGNVTNDIKTNYLTKIDNILSVNDMIDFNIEEGSLTGFIFRLLKNSPVELQQQYSENKYELLVKEMMFPTDSDIQKRIHDQYHSE